MTCHAGIGQTPYASSTLQTEPSRTEPNRPESERMRSAQFYGRSLYTSSHILIAWSIPPAPRRSWRVPSRRCRLEDWASLSSYNSRRVSFSSRKALNTWSVMQGLVRRSGRHSHHKSSRAEPNRLWFVHLFCHELSVKKKVSLPIEQSTLSETSLWRKKWMWRRLSFIYVGLVSCVPPQTS